MFCFRFGNLLVRLLVFEFRNIFSALVFSSISYLCDRWITRKHTAPLLYMFSVFANPSFLSNFHEKELKGGTRTGTVEALATAASSGIPLARPTAAVAHDSS